jgi:trans-aconitate 2-methyltransferase
MPTEWNPDAYRRISALQQWLAERSLAGLALQGDERVLDVGCGDGRVTAEIAAQVPRGAVVGVDASRAMVDGARTTFAGIGNLAYQVGDAAALPFAAAFDVVVSFNALHWVHDQEAAVHGIATALRPGGRALLRFVPNGARRSLEDVIEDTRAMPRWQPAFDGFRSPFVHPEPDTYRALLERRGLTVEQLSVAQEAWDFGSRDAFAHFADATFVAWTQRLPPDERRAFIADVLDRYARLDPPAPANVFTFYQLEARLQV